jgi:hypothetical protein
MSPPVALQRFIIFEISRLPALVNLERLQTISGNFKSGRKVPDVERGAPA